MSMSEHAKVSPPAGRLALPGRQGLRLASWPGRSLPVCLVALFVLLAGLPAGWAQFAAPKIRRIEIKHIGPPAASDELIRSNLRTKVGEPYLRAAVDDDVRSLYTTGFFYNIQVTADDTVDGVVLTY
jgi:outer membrane protein assembly factor BamA